VRARLLFLGRLLHENGRRVRDGVLDRLDHGMKLVNNGFSVNVRQAMLLGSLGRSPLGSLVPHVLGRQGSAAVKQETRRERVNVCMRVRERKSKWRRLASS